MTEGLFAGQCPTCGRCGSDWSSPETRGERDTKGRQRLSTVDRTSAYREWRWGLGNSLYVNDVDQVEWRMVNGEIRPVAVIELTRVDGSVPVPPAYLKAILDRMTGRDPQGRVAVEVASRLGVCAYVVAWRWDLTEFWGYNLSRNVGWKLWTANEYRAWLASLKPPEE